MFVLNSISSNDNRGLELKSFNSPLDNSIMSDIATKITTASLTQLIDKLERDLASASIGEYSALTVRADQLDSKVISINGYSLLMSEDV